MRLTKLVYDDIVYVVCTDVVLLLDVVCAIDGLDALNLDGVHVPDVGCVDDVVIVLNDARIEVDYVECDDILVGDLVVDGFVVDIHVDVVIDLDECLMVVDVAIDVVGLDVLIVDDEGILSVVLMMMLR